jgi:hypothetical protein
MAARIYRPAKTAMQSGRGKTDRWMLVFDQEEPLSVEPLMGYTSAADMKGQIKLGFATKEDAIAYAERKGIRYELDEDHESDRPKINYADNFRPDRRFPWTH